MYVLASSAGISLRNRVVGKAEFFFSKPICRLEPIERPAEEAMYVLCILANINSRYRV